MLYKVYIKVFFKKNVLNSINDLTQKKIEKFEKLKIKHLKIGKAIQFIIEKENLNAKDIESLCSQYFSNNVVEHYQYKIKCI